MAEEHGVKPTIGDDIDEAILSRREGRKIFGVTFPAWRSPIAQGL